jgi:hypothetical protein
MEADRVTRRQLLALAATTPVAAAVTAPTPVEHSRWKYFVGVDWGFCDSTAAIEVTRVDFQTGSITVEWREIDWRTINSDSD